MTKTMCNLAACSVPCGTAKNSKGYEVQTYTDEAGWQTLVTDFSNALGWRAESATFDGRCSANHYIKVNGLDPKTHKAYDALHLRRRQD